MISLHYNLGRWLLRLSPIILAFFFAIVSSFAVEHQSPSDRPEEVVCLNTDVDWQTVIYPRMEPIFRVDSAFSRQDMAPDELRTFLLKSLGDRTRFVAAHIHLVNRFGASSRHCQTRDKNLWTIHYHGLEVILRWTRDNGAWTKTIEYPDEVRQQQGLIRYWTKELSLPARMMGRTDWRGYLRENTTEHPIDAVISDRWAVALKDHGLKWISIGIGEPYPQLNETLANQITENRGANVRRLLRLLEAEDFFSSSYCTYSTRASSRL